METGTSASASWAGVEITVRLTTTNASCPGCVSTVETSAVTLSEHGLAPRFTKAIKECQRLRWRTLFRYHRPLCSGRASRRLSKRRGLPQQYHWVQVPVCSGLRWKPM